MGYVMVMSPCIGCGRAFSFNPTLVPSISVEGSPRRPICADCVARVNPMREKNGLPLIVPHPDAYEPCDESALPND